MKIFKKNELGSMLVVVLVFAAISTVLLTGIVGWAGANIKASREAAHREQAFEIAEAGIEYYRWHLAHSPTDYQDGTGQAGPYVHNYENKEGDVIGQFTLDIIPPPVGSTLVTVRSRGVDNSNPNSYRRIEAVLAKPSYAKYAWLLNAPITFGIGAVTNGPIHSNFGIRFDGLANNTIYSAVASYDDGTHNDNSPEFGVHTHKNVPPPADSVVASFRPLEAPPNSVQARTDVFVAGRKFPVPSIDFTAITAALQTLKDQAIAAGFERPASGANGYHIVLKNNDSFDLYKVNTLINPSNGCKNAAGNPPGWGSWSISTANGSQTLLGNYQIPANGIIFLEDHVWVDGTINTARVTIAAATFPTGTNDRNIIVNNNLLYTNKDGSDSIGLIAQGKILLGLKSLDVQEIDGALIAQTGWIGRYDYPSTNCGVERYRTQLTTYGSLATNKAGAFCYGNDCDNSGYATRIYNYDPYLLYSPPPSFPLTADQYQVLSWKEIN